MPKHDMIGVEREQHGTNPFTQIIRLCKLEQHDLHKL